MRVVVLLVLRRARGRGGTTATDARCKPERNNKRRRGKCPRPAPADPRVASRVASKPLRESDNKTTHRSVFVVYCAVKRPSAPSILTHWSFHMLRGGGGVG